MDLNKFNIFSKGIVSKDKDDDGFFLEAIPTDYMMRIEGDATEVVKVKDVTKSHSLRCKWLNLGNSARMTPPNLKVGEEVLIYRYADMEDAYYWTSYGYTDFDLRKLEHIVYDWADNAKPGKAGKSKRYTLTISTRDKKVEFQTAKGNDEKKIFNLLLDLAKGTLEFGWENDIGLKLDSNDRRATLFGAGLTIPDGNLIVGKEALIKGKCDIKKNLTVHKDTKIIGSTTIVGGTKMIGSLKVLPGITTLGTVKALGFIGPLGPLSMP